MVAITALLETEEQKARFEEVYLHNRDKMYHIAYGILQQKEEAENAVHDSFMKLADKYERYEGLSDREMDGLCIIIVRNTAIDLLHKLNRIRPEEIEKLEFFDWRRHEDKICFPEERVLKKEREEKIKSLLKELPDIYHDVLVMRYYYEMSVSEIARFMGISKETTETRLYRAKKMMRGLFGCGQNK